MKSIFTASLLAMITTLGISGCTTYVTPVNPGRNTCSAHDVRGRGWVGYGPNACRKAMRKCRRWHKRRNFRHWRCM